MTGPTPQSPPSSLGSPSSLPDEAIVARVLQGDLRAFEVLMRRHNQKVYRAARSIVRDDAEAEDVMQDAYVRAFAALSSFRGDASFSSWLLRIAVHESFARVRRRKRFVATGNEQDGADDEVADDNGEPSPEEALGEAEVGRVVEGAIDLLPDDFRTVFVMRAVEELSVKETADVLGIPEDTVKTRFFRARAKLRAILSERVDRSLPQAMRFEAPRCDRIVAGVLARITRGPDGQDG